MPHQPPFDPERRQFFKTVALTAAALVVLPGLASADDAALHSTVYIDLGPEAQFASTDWTRVVLPAKDDSEVIFVKQTKPGAYAALSSRCTHRGCVVNFVTTDKDFVCPCHGGKYDDDGKNISGPPKAPLLTLDAKVDMNGHLLIAQPPKFVPHHRAA